MPSQSPLTVSVTKDGNVYPCEHIRPNLWRCGACHIGKIRVFKLRDWEPVKDYCDWCKAKITGKKDF